uniref:Aminotransferase-like plant mobile domain-containing protein n=1 Tax=Fagus sylvatica TaxID=28930 RepID=A0A2N9FL57_FAGSY
MGHAAYLRKALDVPLSNGIKFARIGVRTRELWLSGSRGVGAVFVHFSDEDSGQTGDAIGEPRVPRRSWSRYLSNAPGLADQLLPMSDFDVLGTVGKLALSYFCKVPDLRRSELGLVRYGPANRGHRSVFGPFEGSFPIGIPASPGKFLAIREFLVVHECVFFPTCPGSRINLLRVRKTLRASVATSVGKFRNFQQNLISSACFHARGRRSSRCRISTILVSSESLCYLFSKVLTITPSFLVRFRLRKVSESKLSACSTHWSGDGQFDSAFGPVNGLVKPWSNLGTVDPSRVGNGSVKPPVKHRSTLVKLVRLGLRANPSGVQMDIPRVEKDRTRTPIDDQFSPTRPTGKYLSIPTLLFSFERCQVRAVGSGGPRRSDRLAKGKAVLYEPETVLLIPMTSTTPWRMYVLVLMHLLPGTCRQSFDAEAAGLASSTVRPSSRPGITIGRSARPSGAPHILPKGGIRPRYPVTTPVVDTSLLTGLHSHPSSSVRRCEDPPESIGRGGWSEFCQLLEIARPEYRDFLVELGFWSLPQHPLRASPARWGCSPSTGAPFWAFALGVGFLLAILCPDFEALEILGIDDPAAIVGKKLFYLKISYLWDLLVREMEEPPTELRYRQWTAYFIFSCFLGNDKSTIPTPIVGMFRDIDDLRDYDWGALTYGFYIRGLRRFSRRQTSSFLGFWQFTLFWAFEHFTVFAPSRLPAAPDSVFPLARRWDSAWIQRLTSRTLLECRTTVDCIRDADIVFQPYPTFLLERPEVFRAMELSRLRIWIRSPRSWELLMGERSLRQLGGEALVPVDPPHLMTIEDYIPRAPSDSFVAGVEAYPDLIRADVPYREWFEQVSLGPLMSLHEVEGGRVMGGAALDSHLFQSSGEFERLQTEILRLQLELSVSEDRHVADMDPGTGGDGPCAGGADPGAGGDGADAGGLDPEPEGLGFSRCGAGCSCGDHSEIRGSASWYGHYSCYWGWLVRFRSDFYYAAS